MPNPAAIRQKVMEKMESALEHLKRDLAGLRTGRASGLPPSTSANYNTVPVRVHPTPRAKA